MQEKIRDRDRDRERQETQRDRDTHTDGGVRDRSIKGRESKQYVEMHEDEGEAAIAAAAVRRNRTAEEKRAAQMRWRGKKGIQRWPCYIWGETHTERRGVRGFRQHGKGPPVQPVTGKEGRPGEGGEVDTYVPILPYDRYPIPKCSNSFFSFLFFSCGCDSVNMPSPLPRPPPPQNQTGSDDRTPHQARLTPLNNSH